MNTTLCISVCLVVGLALLGCEETAPDAPPTFTGDVSDQVFTAGEEISLLTLPEAVGGNGQLSYELRPEVPGLTFDRGTRTLSGTPRIVDTYRMSYRVSDADENKADRDADTLTFIIVVRDGDTAPTFAGEVSDQGYTVGEEIRLLTLPGAAGGNGQLSYELRPEVPGLTFDRGARTLSGTPRIVDTYRMSYRVSDADENKADRDADTLTFAITVWPIPSMSGTYRGSGDQVFAINPAYSRWGWKLAELRLGGGSRVESASGVGRG